MTRHPRAVYGASKGKAPGQKYPVPIVRTGERREKCAVYVAV